MAANARAIASEAGESTGWMSGIGNWMSTPWVANTLHSIGVVLDVSVIRNWATSVPAVPSTSTLPAAAPSVATAVAPRAAMLPPLLPTVAAAGLGYELGEAFKWVMSDQNPLSKNNVMRWWDNREAAKKPQLTQAEQDKLDADTGLLTEAQRREMLKDLEAKGETPEQKARKEADEAKRSAPPLLPPPPMADLGGKMSAMMDKLWEKLLQNPRVQAIMFKLLDGVVGLVGKHVPEMKGDLEAIRAGIIEMMANKVSPQPTAKSTETPAPVAAQAASHAVTTPTTETRTGSQPSSPDRASLKSLTAFVGDGDGHSMTIRLADLPDPQKNLLLGDGARVDLLNRAGREGFTPTAQDRALLKRAYATPGLGDELAKVTDIALGGTRPFSPSASFMVGQL